jgi:hypothetical protein
MCNVCVCERINYSTVRFFSSAKKCQSYVRARMHARKPVADTVKLDPYTQSLRVVRI